MLTHLIAWLDRWAGPIALQVAVAATLLLVVALLLSWALRRSAAALRHRVWALAILGLLAYPLVQPFLPKISLGLFMSSPEGISNAHFTGKNPQESTSFARTVLPRQDRILADETATHADLPAAPLPKSKPQIAADGGVWTSVVETLTRTFASHWPSMLAAVWAIGAAIGLAFLLNVHRTAFQLAQSATLPTDPSWAEMAGTVAAQLGIRRRVAVRSSDRIAVPVTAGWLRPVILLPATEKGTVPICAQHPSGRSGKWGLSPFPDARQRMVLVHELSHVARGDVLWQIAAKLACVIYWPHPLVWLAARRMRVEREAACDDAVLRDVERPSEYASLLLDVAKSLSDRSIGGKGDWLLFPEGPEGCSAEKVPVPFSAAVAMACGRSVEDRIRWIVEPNRCRMPIGRRTAGWFAVGAILILYVVGSISLFAGPPASNAPGSPSDADTQKEQNGEEPKSVANAKQPKGGEVLDPGAEQRLRWGEPAAGLRAAIAIRTTSGKPQPGDFPDLYLAVQNVSPAPIRLNDTATAPKIREVYLKKDGRIQLGIFSKDPTGTDIMLEPREVAMLLIFPGKKNADGRTGGSIMADDLLKDPHLTMVGELQIKHAPAGAWTGKLRTGETSGEVAAGKPQPKSKEGQTLFRQWQANARTDGKIAGALVGKLGENVRWEVAHNNGGHGRTARYERLLPRFDATRDWSPSDAVTLIDDVSAIDTNPIAAALFAADKNMMRPGRPLPVELANAPWGKPSADGLRVAWLLEPRAKQYPLNTALKSHVLVHNSGKKTAVFCMMSWVEGGGSAHDATGAALRVSVTHWLVTATKKTYRLAPGEYCETLAAGVDVGLAAKPDTTDWVGTHVGARIDAKPSDEVRFSPCDVPLPADGADLWPRIVAERVGRELPLPTAAADREQIIRRVTLDLFGKPPTPEEIAVFINDQSPTAVANLEKHLANRPGIAPFFGTLSPGDFQFRVLAPDLDAAKRPQVVSGAGNPNALLQRDAPLNVLVEALQSKDFSTRMRAVDFIGDRGAAAKAAVPALVKAFEAYELRESALIALKKIGPRASAAIPALVKALTAYPEQPATRWYAADALASIGEDAIPTLKKGTESANLYERLWCHAALAKIEGPKSPHLQVLAELMASEDKTASLEAVRGLTMIGPNAKSVLPQIIAAMDSPTTPKTDLAVLLAQMGKDAAPAIPQLVALLDNSNAMTRQRAAYALSTIGDGALRPAVPGLARMLTAPEGYVREMAATALGTAGPTAKEAIRSLIGRLRDEDERVRAASATALGKIAPTDATVQSALVEAMKDESGRVRSSAAPVLAEYAPVTKEMIQVFLRASDDNWKAVDQACETFFHRLGPEDRKLIPKRYSQQFPRD
jgi:beta-lactamase regulating signal transducer with metallopeptidase domain/HEAT repeat protein